MSYTTVRTHTRNGHQVRSHTRRTNRSAVAEVLMRDMYRVYEELVQDGATERIVRADPHCPHPGWYPLRRCDPDTPYEDSPVLAYACTGCAATKPAQEARERVLAETEERI